MGIHHLETSMNEQQPSWIEQQCKRLVPIERETIEKLGEETGMFFINAGNDCVTIGSTISTAYPGEKNWSLVMLTLWMLFKEAGWFHSYFVAGNYPVLLARLRFIWESMFRAYFVKHYHLWPCADWDTPGPTVAEKMAWLEKYGHKLNWNNCIEPVLRAVFPLAEQEQTVRDDCKEIFQYLHRYAHPSAYLLDRMIDDPAFLVIDAFDEGWARQTVEIGRKVFALVWMAVFKHYPDAFVRIEPLSGKYPVLSDLFEGK
jgi:hypothetical protein